MKDNIDRIVESYLSDKVAQELNADFKSDVKGLFNRAIGLSDTNPQLAQWLWSGRDSDKIDVVKRPFKASKLLPSQTTMDIELALDVTLAVLRDNETVGDLNSIVSSDNYIMDGHHRWAAMIMAFGTRAKVTAFQADLEAVKLIRILNIITRGVFGKDKGNVGTGSLQDFTPQKVRKTMMKLLKKGTYKGPFYKSPKEIVRILTLRFGSVPKGIDSISNNARLLTRTAPNWAPDRRDMPVIEESEVGLTEALLESGWDADVDSPRNPILLPHQPQNNREDRLRTTLPNFRFASAKQHYEEVMSRFRMPRLDRERYTPLKGMEGPFQFKGGWVLYYDPREGKYYDRDTDMYLSDRDADRITSRTASLRFAGSGIKAVEALGINPKKAKNFLQALASEILSGRVIKSKTTPIKDYIELDRNPNAPTNSPYEDYVDIDGVSGVSVKSIVEIPLVELEKASRMSLKDTLLYPDNGSAPKKALADLADAITKNITHNHLERMSEEDRDEVLGEVMYYIESDLEGTKYQIRDAEMNEYDYQVQLLSLTQRVGYLHVVVKTSCDYAITVEDVGFDDDY